MTQMIQRPSGRIAALFAAIGLAPASALAHPAAMAHVHGFAQGFAHPISGVDHLVAMVAVGLLAVQLGGRALWLLPLTFLAVMGLAGVAGMEGMDLPFAEIGIGASVIVLGLIVASRLQLPTILAAVLVGVFAVFHGQAHGAEMPPTLSGLAYGAGFLSATALLHGLGIGLGFAGRRLARAVRPARLVWP